MRRLLQKEVNIKEVRLGVLTRERLLFIPRFYCSYSCIGKCFFSLQCRDSVKEAFQTIEILIASKQFSKLKFDFSSCNDISHPNDTVQFVTDLAGVFATVVQYNDEKTWMNIRKLCGYMTNTYKSSYQRLMDVNEVR